jgi:hypothetical protein
MYKEGINRLINRVFEKIVLYAKESYPRTVIVTFTLIIFGVPLLGYLQNQVRQIPYLRIAQQIYFFLTKNLNTLDTILILSLLASFFCSWRLWQELLKTRLIKELLSNDLRSWSIPTNSGWSIQDCQGYLGKMLAITSSPRPGTLKEAFSWYDYEITFQVRFGTTGNQGNENFNVVLRSENYLNGVVIQFSEKYMRPYLLYEGKMIFDKASERQLPTILPKNDWINFKISLRGNDVEILAEGYKLLYIIPSRRFTIDQETFDTQRQKSLIDLENSENSLSNKKSVENQQWETYQKLPEGEEKTKAGDSWLKLYRDLPKEVQINLEYQKGSFGFMTTDPVSSTYFRKLIVKKI